jgi:hypothetical protein
LSDGWCPLITRRSAARRSLERGEDPTVDVDLEVASADVGDPADRVERDRPRVAEDDEPAEPAGGAVDEDLLTVPPERRAQVWAPPAATAVAVAVPVPRPRCLTPSTARP